MQSTLLFLTGAALTLSGGAFAAPGGFYPNGGYEYYENIKPQFHEHNGYKYDPTISPPLRPKAPYPPKEPYGKDQFRNNYYPYGNDYDNRPAEIEIEVEFSVPEDFEVGRGFGNNYDYDGYNNNYPEPKYESRPKYEYGPRPENQYNPRPDVVVEPVLEVVEVDERERASDYKNDERFNNDKKSEDEREAKTLEGYEADNKIASSQLGFGFEKGAKYDKGYGFANNFVNKADEVFVEAEEKEQDDFRKSNGAFEGGSRPAYSYFGKL